MIKTGIITQARMTSTRLPGKIFLKANGKTVLEHHVNRLAWSNVPAYIATTTNEVDNAVVEAAKSFGVSSFRGDEHNVLQRFFQCAEKYELDVIVRVTSDCPLIDGNIISDGLNTYLALNDPKVYYSNCLVRTFPRGLDFEIFSFELLWDAFLNASTEADKEHVTPYINQNKGKQTKIIHHTSDSNQSNLRWTLDTDDDWKLLRILLDDYNAGNLRYSEILKVIQHHPELAILNTHIRQKEINL